MRDTSCGTDTNTRYADEIAWCGQCLVDNAPELASHIKYRAGGLDLIIRIRPDSQPTIELRETFIPDGFVEQVVKRRQE